MKVRYAVFSDIAALKALERGFPYVDFDSKMLEMVLVVADEDNKPLCAVAAERIVQLFFWCGDLPPLQQKAAIQMLHEVGADVLKAKGYTEVNAFLPPSIVVKFSKRLQRTWNWKPNWPSWCKRF